MIKQQKEGLEIRKQKNCWKNTKFGDSRHVKHN